MGEKLFFTAKKAKTIRKGTTTSKTEAKHEPEHVCLSFILRILKNLPLFYSLRFPIPHLKMANEILPAKLPMYNALLDNKNY